MDFSYQGRNPPAQLAAMAASYNTTPDQTWFADSWATNHITNDMNNLSVDYQGNDKVQIGNGTGLHILKTGSSIISTPNSNFHLKNILHALVCASIY